MRGLSGRRHLVCGGASGIGAATARRLAAEGARVVVADRDEAAAHALADELGEPAIALGYQQQSPESVATLFARATADGPLHGVALVAGTHLGSIALPDVTPDAVRTVHEVNVLGVLLVVRQAVASLVEDAGSLVVVGSVAGLRPEAQDAVYAASKAAAHAVARSAALEAAPRGIRVNSVLPGEVVTPLNVRLSTSAAAIEERSVRAVPLGRAATAEEVANVITFLLSEEASYVTGSEILVDGGLFAASP